MPAISKMVRDAIRERLAAAYETTLTKVCLEYGIKRPQAIDFADPKARNFFQGYLHPDAIENSTVKSYPMAILYAVGSANENLEKFREFSGRITLNLDIYLSWPTIKAINDFETLGDAVEATLYRVFHDPEWADAYTDFVYNGDLSVVRRPLEQAGENWRQAVSARVICQADI
jgi:hypothetical protein